MGNKKTIYNADKENTIFAKKLRELSKAKGITQQALADYIGEHTGETITRQSVGQWFIGSTCPSLRVVPLIAQFFGVSTDYLLTETKTKTPDEKIRAAVDDMGISEKSVENIRAITASGLKADLLLESEQFSDILKHLSEIERLEISKEYYERVMEPAICDISSCDEFSKMVVTNPFIEILNRDFDSLFDFFPGCLSDSYKDKSDLEEFKLTKALAGIADGIKKNANCTEVFSENNKFVKDYLYKDLNEIILECRKAKATLDLTLKKTDDESLKTLCAINEARISEIQTFLEKFDKNFNLKEGENENGSNNTPKE